LARTFNAGLFCGLPQVVEAETCESAIVSDHLQERNSLFLKKVRCLLCGVSPYGEAGQRRKEL
jgi:hypothetical protein